MLEKYYYLLLIGAIFASITGFQFALWGLPSLVFVAINLVVLCPAYIWIDEVGLMIGKLERKLLKSTDIKAGLLSGFIYIIGVFLLTVVFILICFWRLAAYFWQ